MNSAITLKLDFLMPGLNGSDGLIRQHFHKAAKVKGKLRQIKVILNITKNHEIYKDKPPNGSRKV